MLLCVCMNQHFPGLRAKIEASLPLRYKLKQRGLNKCLNPFDLSKETMLLSHECSILIFEALIIPSKSKRPSTSLVALFDALYVQSCEASPPALLHIIELVTTCSSPCENMLLGFGQISLRIDVKRSVPDLTYWGFEGVKQNVSVKLFGFQGQRQTAHYSLDLFESKGEEWEWPSLRSGVFFSSLSGVWPGGE